MDATAPVAVEGALQVDAEAKGDSTLRTHNLFLIALERTDADSHTVDADAGSTLLVVYSLPGCTPRKAGTWDPAAVGTHRS